MVASGILLAREHSLEIILKQIVETARELVGAKYAALGVISSDGSGELSEFVTTGLDAETRRDIGELPRGRGLLGVLITGAAPVRLAKISDDPRAVGFPPHHPPMDSFLGVRVGARGTVFGNIYLTEKIGADEFSEEDEAIALVLAEQAGVAIENARLFERVRERARRETRRAVLKRTIEAQEEERQRLARELHDETGQSLTAVMLALRVLEKGGLDGDQLEQVSQLREQVGDALREVRRLAVRLRPTALDDLGLVAGIERLVGDSLPQTVDVSIDGEGLDGVRLDDAIETVVYRLIQEAITNIGKHSDAGRVRIVIKIDRGDVIASVSDNGKGFDPSTSSAGVGLIGMRERVETVGGTLSVTSARAEGTRIAVRIPMFT